MANTATALVFPGQGAQRVGMAADLYEHSRAVRLFFELASAVCDLDLLRLCREGPDEELRRTDVAQPALLVAELSPLVALAERLGGASGRIDDAVDVLGVTVVAGHSLGEYGAAVASGALSLEDGVRLAAARGRAMARARAGTMAAVLGIDADRVRELCDGLTDVVVANDNAPGQIVVSGSVEAVAALSAAAREAGATKSIPLKVSGAFHSPLMGEAADEFAGALDTVEVRRPRLLLIGNVSAQPICSAEDMRAELKRQIVSPVRWRESVRRIVEAGAQRALECGPGHVLAGLIRRTAPELPVRPFGSWNEVMAFADEGASEP